MKYTFVAALLLATVHTQEVPVVAEEDVTELAAGRRVPKKPRVLTEEEEAAIQILSAGKPRRGGAKALTEEEEDALELLAMGPREEVEDEIVELEQAKTEAETGSEEKAGPEDTETTPPATEPAAEETGSGAVWWVVGILAAAGLGGGVFWYRKRQSEAQEGGDADLYEKIMV